VLVLTLVGAFITRREANLTPTIKIVLLACRIVSRSTFRQWDFLSIEHFSEKQWDSQFLPYYCQYMFDTIGHC